MMDYPRSTILTALIGLTFAALLIGQDQPAADAKKPADRTREHRVIDIEGWQIHVDTKLLDGPDKPLGDLALRVLGNHLFRITMVVPEDKVAAMRQVPVYLDLDHPLTSMQYHPNIEWLRDRGYDLGLTKAVHIPRAAGLVEHMKNNHQPWVMLHELAHAYHDRVLGFDHEAIRDTWRQVREAGLYDQVLHIRHRTTRHYALTDHKEYFAEMTEAYFGTNDFFPFVAAELKSHDPRTFALLESVWGKRP